MSKPAPVYEKEKLPTVDEVTATTRVGAGSIYATSGLRKKDGKEYYYVGITHAKMPVAWGKQEASFMFSKHQTRAIELLRNEPEATDTAILDALLLASAKASDWYTSGKPVKVTQAIGVSGPRVPTELGK